MAKFDPLIDRTFKVVGQSGDERVCVCPWHPDGNKPNLYVNAVKGVYLCHSCGAKGSLVSGANRHEMTVAADLGYLRERVKEMAEPRTHHLRIYPESWLNQFDFPHPYWTDERNFSPEIIRRFRLGYDPVSDTATIPIRSSRGEVLGVIQRRLDDQKPKYLHPKGFKMGQDLFGSWLVRKRRHHRVALVEGPLDAVACWDAHVPALALHGARLSVDQAKLLRQLGVNTVVCMTDNDAAGDEAIHQIKETLTGIPVLVGWYRDHWQAKDPGELHPRRRRQMYGTAKPYHQSWS